MKGARRSRKHRPHAGFADLMSNTPSPQHGVVTGLSRVQTPPTTRLTPSAAPRSPVKSPSFMENDDWGSILDTPPKRKVSPQKPIISSVSHPDGFAKQTRTLSSSHSQPERMLSNASTAPQREEEPSVVPAFLSGWDGADGWEDDALEESDQDIDDDAWGGAWSDDDQLQNSDQDGDDFATAAPTDSVDVDSGHSPAPGAQTDIQSLPESAALQQADPESEQADVSFSSPLDDADLDTTDKNTSIDHAFDNDSGLPSAAPLDAAEEEAPEPSSEVPSEQPVALPDESETVQQQPDFQPTSSEFEAPDGFLEVPTPIANVESTERSASEQEIIESSTVERTVTEEAVETQDIHEAADKLTPSEQPDESIANTEEEIPESTIATASSAHDNPEATITLQHEDQVSEPASDLFATSRAEANLQSSATDPFSTWGGVEQNDAVADDPWGDVDIQNEDMNDGAWGVPIGGNDGMIATDGAPKNAPASEPQAQPGTGARETETNDSATEGSSLPSETTVVYSPEKTTTTQLAAMCEHESEGIAGVVQDIVQSSIDRASNAPVSKEGDFPQADLQPNAGIVEPGPNNDTAVYAGDGLDVASTDAQYGSEVHTERDQTDFANSFLPTAEDASQPGSATDVVAAPEAFTVKATSTEASADPWDSTTKQDDQVPASSDPWGTAHEGNQRTEAPIDPWVVDEVPGDSSANVDPWDVQNNRGHQTDSMDGWDTNAHSQTRDPSLDEVKTSGTATSVIQPETVQLPAPTSEKSFIATTPPPITSAVTPSQMEEPPVTQNNFTNSASYDPWGADNSGTGNDGWGWGDNSETITGEAEDQDRRKSEAGSFIEETQSSEAQVFVSSTKEHLESSKPTVVNEQVQQNRVANAKDSSASYDPWGTNSASYESVIKPSPSTEVQAFVSSTAEHLENDESETANDHKEEIPQAIVTENTATYDPWGTSSDGAMKDDGWGWRAGGDIRVSEPQPSAIEASPKQYGSMEATTNIDQEIAPVEGNMLDLQDSATTQLEKGDTVKSASYDPWGVSNGNAENTDGWGWTGGNMHSGVEPDTQPNMASGVESDHAFERPEHEALSQSTHQVAVATVHNSVSMRETDLQEDLLPQPRSTSDVYKPIVSSESQIRKITMPTPSNPNSELKQGAIPDKVTDESWGAEIRSVDAEFSSTVAGTEVPSVTAASSVDDPEWTHEKDQPLWDTTPLPGYGTTLPENEDKKPSAPGNTEILEAATPNERMTLETLDTFASTSNFGRETPAWQDPWSVQRTQEPEITASLGNRTAELNQANNNGVTSAVPFNPGEELAKVPGAVPASQNVMLAELAHKTPHRRSDDNFLHTKTSSFPDQYASAVQHSNQHVIDDPINNMASTFLKPYATTTMNSAFAPSSSESKPAELQQQPFHTPPQHQQPQASEQLPVNPSNSTKEIHTSEEPPSGYHSVSNLNSINLDNLEPPGQQNTGDETPPFYRNTLETPAEEVPRNSFDVYSSHAHNMPSSVKAIASSEAVPNSMLPSTVAFHSVAPPRNDVGTSFPSGMDSLSPKPMASVYELPRSAAETAKPPNESFITPPPTSAYDPPPFPSGNAYRESVVPAHSRELSTANNESFNPVNSTTYGIELRPPAAAPAAPFSINPSQSAAELPGNQPSPLLQPPLVPATLAGKPVGKLGHGTTGSTPHMMKTTADISSASSNVQPSNEQAHPPSAFPQPAQSQEEHLNPSGTDRVTNAGTSQYSSNLVTPPAPPVMESSSRNFDPYGPSDPYEVGFNSQPYQFSIMDTGISSDPGYREPRPVISWGFGGTLLTVMPSRSVTRVNLHEMNAVGQDGSNDEWSAAAEAVPPVPYPIRENDLQSYGEMCDRLSRMSAGLSGSAAESRAALWRLLALMCRDGSWRAGASQAIGGPTSVPTFGSYHHSGLAGRKTNESPFLNEMTGSQTFSDEQVSASTEVERLVSQGNVTEAVRVATESELWSVALVLATSINQSSQMNIISEFAKKTLKDGSALQTLSFSVAQNDREILQRASSPVGLKEWRKTIKMLLTAQPSSSNNKSLSIIDQLGDALVQNGDVTAGHTCFLVSGRIQALQQHETPLLGANPSTPSGRPGSSGSAAIVLQSLVYEAICNARHGKTFPHILPYRLLLAEEIAAAGRPEVALAHVESISNLVRSVFESGQREIAAVFTAPFLANLESIEGRLRTCLGLGQVVQRRSALSALGKSLASAFTGRSAATTPKQESTSFDGTLRESRRQIPTERLLQSSPGSRQSMSHSQPILNAEPNSDYNNWNAPERRSAQPSPENLSIAGPPIGSPMVQQQPMPSASASAGNENLDSGNERWNSLVSKTIRFIAPAEGDLSPPAKTRSSATYLANGQPSPLGLGAPAGSRMPGMEPTMGHSRSASVGAFPVMEQPSFSFAPGREMMGNAQQNTSTKPTPNQSTNKYTEDSLNGVSARTETKSGNEGRSGHKRAASDLTFVSQSSEMKPPRPPKNSNGTLKSFDNKTAEKPTYRGWRSRLSERLKAAFGGPPKAHMGVENKFVYDKARGRWVMEGEDPDEEDDAPPPPPEDDPVPTPSANVHSSLSYESLPNPDISNQPFSHNFGTSFGGQGADPFSDRGRSFAPQNQFRHATASRNGSVENFTTKEDTGSERSFSSTTSAPVQFMGQSGLPPPTGAGNKFRAGSSRLSGRRAYVDTFNQGKPPAGGPVLAPSRPVLPTGGFGGGSSSFQMFTPSRSATSETSQSLNDGNFSQNQDRSGSGQYPSMSDTANMYNTQKVNYGGGFPGQASAPENFNPNPNPSPQRSSMSQTQSPNRKRHSRLMA